MDSARRDRFERNFKLMFEEDTQNLTPKDRLDYLLDLLIIYLGRWNGFCNNKEISVYGLLDIDVNVSIWVAVDYINAELLAEDYPPSLTLRWQHFVALLCLTQKFGKTASGAIIESANSVREELH